MKKDKDTFVPKSNVSYSAGLAFILLASGVPELALVLQSGGEKNTQKDGSSFVEERTWKVPMGHFDKDKDFNLLDAALREFEEETGFELSRATLSVQGMVTLRIKSDRPGSLFHEDRFFLASSDEMPDMKEQNKRDDIIEKVHLFKLTDLPLADRVDGAVLAYGHRKKLSLLFSDTRDFFESIYFDIDPVLAALAPKFNT